MHSRIVVVKCEGQRPTGRPCIRWEGNDRKGLEETGRKELDASGFGKGQEES
jgi:hypothetical protein